MPAALLSVPYSREPASVIPTWVGIVALRGVLGVALDGRRHVARLQR